MAGFVELFEGIGSAVDAVFSDFDVTVSYRNGQRDDVAKALVCKRMRPDQMELASGFVAGADEILFVMAENAVNAGVELRPGGWFELNGRRFEVKKVRAVGAHAQGAIAYRVLGKG